ncbi:MAG: ROK family protein [Candidatus Cloacimonetes bacterium]|nr:ROK family protein [Candidatus Cloacimonadota bacterium]
MSIIAVLDLGGSSLKFGYGTTTAGLIWDSKIELTQISRKDIYAVIEDAVTQICNHSGETLTAIVLGSPGQVNSETGQIISGSPNLPDWKGANPGHYLREIFSVPVQVENDANLMAFGEAGRWNYEKTVLGITLGSGIGGGFVEGGKIFRGSGFSALEIGHTIVHPGGRSCLCGKKGCLEAYSSAASLLRQVEEAGVNEVGFLSLQTLLEKCDSNPIIKKIVEESVELLALAIANVAIILDPDIIVIGGGMSDIPAFNYDLLCSNIARFREDNTSREWDLRPAYYGNKAALRGGIYLSAKKKV